MADKFVQFFESAFIEKQIDALARGQFAGLMFTFAAFEPAAGFCFFAAAAQFGDSSLLGVLRGCRRFFFRHAALQWIATLRCGRCEPRDGWPTTRFRVTEQFPAPAPRRWRRR